MESLDFMSKILDGRVVLGKKEELGDGLYIIPVYKVKITFLNLKTDLKDNSGDGDSESISVTPICILKSHNGNVDIITFEEKTVKDSIVESIPNVLSNIDIGSMLKNIKI